MAHARNDGRGRTTGDAVDEGEELGAYILPEEGALKVFRCRQCEVRVAQESDLCRRARFDHPAATFTRTFNLVRVGDDVCCCRCGLALFPADDRDPAMLTLPLLWEGEKTLKKTALRGVVMLYKWDLPYFRFRTRDDGQLSMSKHQAFKSLEEQLPGLLPGRDVEWTFLAYMNADVPDTDNWLYLEFTPERIETAMQAYRKYGVHKFTFVFRNRLGSFMEALPTQDVGLIAKTESGGYLYWTDYPSADMEEPLMRMWMACGGNLQICDWYLPNGFKEERFGEFEDVATSFLNKPMDINRMPSMCQLMRDGNYLGWWEQKHRKMPEKALELLRQAADYRRTYPRWLFVRDFPPSQFDNPLRRQGACSAPRENFTPFALKAVDVVSPIFPTTPTPPTKAPTTPAQKKPDECHLL